MDLFDSTSASLFSFFRSSWAYYIPFYQRQYSWDTENVKKLMDDTYDGVKQIGKKPSYLRFIGAVILFQEQSPVVGKHYDYKDLLDVVFNVIDGQQRISTLAVVACLLHNKLVSTKYGPKSIRTALTDSNNRVDEDISRLQISIENSCLVLEDLYSFQVRRASVFPERKPLIIRALDAYSNPRTDQWTLKGQYKDFYKSDVAAFVAQYIEDGTVSNKVPNERLQANIAEINTWISRTIESPEFPTAEELLSESYSVLGEFADRNIDLANLYRHDVDLHDLAGGAIRLLAFIKFLTHRTYLPYIK